MENTPEEIIIQEIEKQNTTMSWVAGKAGVTKVHLHYVLRGKTSEKRKLSAQLLAKINEALGTDIAPTTP